MDHCVFMYFRNPVAGRTQGDYTSYMKQMIMLAVGGTLCLSLISTYLVRSWAIRVDFVDRPLGHKKHSHPIALGGGIALMISIGLPILIGTGIVTYWPTDSLPAWWPTLIQRHLDGIASKWPVVLAMLSGMLALHIVGLLDDRNALGAGSKFIIQLIVAIVTAWPMGIRIAEFLPVPYSICITVFWIVLITNAFNFLDNMDGLSAGVAAIAAAIIAITSMSAGQIFVPILAWVIVGSLLGFLWFNFSPATIFMGDAGSMVIGYLISVLTILTTYYDPSMRMSAMGIIVPLVVLSVPLYDVISVVILRIRLGESPFRADWRHFSHRLVKRGMTQRGAVLTIYLATAATGLPAIVLSRIEWPLAILLLLQCVCVVLMIAILEHTGIKEKMK